MTDEEIKRYAARLDDTNLCDRIETADGFIDEHGIDSYVGALAADYRVALEALTAARRERDEALAQVAEQRGRAAERRRMRAAVEQMMADAVHEAADARQQCVDHGETRIRLDDRARASGRIDTCEAVLEMLDGRHVGAVGKNGGGE